MGMRALVLLIPLMLLSACDNLFLKTQQYTFAPPPTRAGQICAKQCPLTKTQCMRNCEALKNNCIHEDKVAAQRSYIQYVNERMAQGMLVDKTEAQFYQAPTNCNTLQTCQQGCDVNMRTCHSQCGGTVLQDGNCLANCQNAPAKDTLDELHDWFSDKDDN